MATLTDFTFGIIDYAVFVLTLIASLAIGIYFGYFAKSNNTPEEYLMGSRKMKMLPIAISIIASQLSSVTITSVPAEFYTFGFNTYFLVIAISTATPILMYIVAPIFYDNHFKNCYEYLQARFNKPTRQVVTASFLLSSLLTVPVHMFLPSMAFSQVSGFNVHIINAVICSISVLYTMLGGIKAVVWTSVWQSGIVLGSIILVGVTAIAKTGGFAQVIEKAYEGGRLKLNYSTDFRERSTVWGSFCNGVLYWIGHIGVNQSCVQRIISLPSVKHAQRSYLVIVIGLFIILSVNSFISLAMYAYYHNCDPVLAGYVKSQEKIMPFFVENILGHLKGTPGIFISCVFSASLSTISGFLNSMAGVVYFDYIKPIVKPHSDARANFIMKIIVIVIGCYCVAAGLIVENFDSLLHTLLAFMGINTGGVVALFLLGIFVPRINGKTALTAFSLTFVMMSWLVWKNQMRTQNGELKYEHLPTNIDGCDALNLEIIKENFTTTLSSTTENVLNINSIENRKFSMYDISFNWFAPLGALLLTTFALLLSFIWRNNKFKKRNPKLYSPLVRHMVRTQSMELPEVEPLKILSELCEEN